MNSIIEISANWFLIYVLLISAAAIAIRVGVFCLAIESIFLTSAFVTAALSQHYILNTVTTFIALISGIIVLFLFILLTEVLGLETIITGIAINLFCSGGISYFMYKVYKSTFLGASDTAGAYLSVAVFAILLLATADFIVYRSLWRARFVAVGEAIRAAEGLDISIFRYRTSALLLTSLLASSAGIFFCLAEHGVGNSQWSEGIGFVAIGVAFITCNSTLHGILLSLVLAALRTVAIGLSTTREGCVGVLVQMSPYFALLLFISLPPLIRKIKGLRVGSSNI